MNPKPGDDSLKFELASSHKICTGHPTPPVDGTASLALNGPTERNKTEAELVALVS
jgi:hypothetical protein